MSETKGFLKAQGCKLVNGNGQEILLRGVGLGGWLLSEGYMWRLPQNMDRPRRIEKMIVDMVGEAEARDFWEKYYNSFISEADICKIASEGFNSIRVPINARHLILLDQKPAFDINLIQLIDRVIAWCKKYKLYVILDLHGAPGGQTGTNIDDSENDSPELFVSEQNKYLTVELWRMLADRYKDEYIIAGYDLLNEPLPDWFSKYNNEVMPLYKEITKAIREVDKNHIIILEGVHWATDWSIFKEKTDDNMMLQFHKYWNNPDTESIKPYLDMREKLKVPIFMGEGGENNKSWYAGAFRLLEDHGISWNFWTWKKMSANNSPCSVNMPEGWQQSAGYLQGGAIPDKASARRILSEYLENISIEHCEYHAEVVNSIFRRPPVLIPAIFYGFKGNGIDWGITERKETEICFRENDGIEIKFIEGNRLTPNFKHMAGEEWKPDEWLYVCLNKGEWTSYEFNIPTACNLQEFSLKLRLYTESDSGDISVTIDDNFFEAIKIGRNLWDTVCLKDKISLETGQHKIILKAEGGPVGVAWLELCI